MKPLVFHPEAEAELEVAVALYEQQREGLGATFQVAVEAALDRIARQPRLFSPYKDAGLRKCVMQRFPYSIFYLELDDLVWIAAVAHQRRKPDYWASRSAED